MHCLDLFSGFQIVHKSIVLGILHLEWIHVRPNTKATNLPKLNQIATNTTKPIKNVQISSSSIHINNPLRNMFGHRLRCNTIPRFIINLDAYIKLTEKIISFIPKSSQFGTFGPFGLRSTTLIILLFLGYEYLFCSFNGKLLFWRWGY